MSVGIDLKLRTLPILPLFIALVCTLAACKQHYLPGQEVSVVNDTRQDVILFSCIGEDSEDLHAGQTKELTVWAACSVHRKAKLLIEIPKQTGRYQGCLAIVPDENDQTSIRVSQLDRGASLTACAVTKIGEVPDLTIKDKHSGNQPPAWLAIPVLIGLSVAFAGGFLVSTFITVRFFYRYYFRHV